MSSIFYNDNSISNKNSIPHKNSTPRTPKTNTRKRKPEDEDKDEDKDPKKHKPAEKYTAEATRKRTPEDKGENEDKGEDKDNQPKKKHKPYNGNISSLDDKNSSLKPYNNDKISSLKPDDNGNNSSLKLAFKKGVNAVINANRFRVIRTKKEEEDLVKTFELEKTWKPKYKESYLEERGFIKKFFTDVSNYLKQTISGSTNTSSTLSKKPINIDIIRSRSDSPLSTDFIHPPLPAGWTEVNNNYAPPYFIDSYGKRTDNRPYVPLPPIPSTVSSKWVSCTIFGHGGLVNVYPRLFSPGPMCHVRYFASFANPVLANHASDIRAYKLQIPNTSIAGPTAIRRVNSIGDYDDDYKVLTEYAYDQKKYENRVSINIRRTKQTDSITCLNKMFTFSENIGPNVKISQSGKDEIKRINEANFGVYIMRNNLGIQEGHKLDITDIDGYPDNVVFQDIAGFITQQLQLGKTDHLYVLDPTCNPIIYLGDLASEKRFLSRNYEQLIEEINKNPSVNSEILSSKISSIYPSAYGKGGSKRRKQKKTRKNKKM